MRSITISRNGFVGLAAGVLLLGGASARAGDARDWVYAAPVICSEGAGSAGLAPGVHSATLSVVNPSPGQRVRMRVSLTTPSDVEPSDPIVRRLRRFASTQLDCTQLRSDLFFPTPLLAPLVMGWVLIESEKPLEVAVVQSSVGEEGDTSVSTIDVDGRLTARPRPPRVDVCHREHTIEIDAGALVIHLGHGDRRGECDEDRD